MSEAIGSFGKIAAILSRGPLGIIALFYCVGVRNFSSARALR